MEMLNLKPSFGRKLNTSGNSPLHLAVNEDQTAFVSWMLKHDHSLACVKGRYNITPYHYLVIRGNAHLVAECLLASPECIQDTSVNGHNALHLAVMNDRFGVLKVLTGWIQRMSQRNALMIENRFLNKEDFNCNTALHLAAYKNDLQAVKLLLKCQLVERNKVNGDGLTFLDVLRNLENAGDWDLDLKQVVLKTRCKEAASMPKPKAVSAIIKRPLTFTIYCVTVIKRIRSNTSEEARGAFLIVFTLLITATYQTALQPPGGGHQSKDPHSSNADVNNEATQQTFFFFLWIVNTVGFYSALCNTYCLLPLRRPFTIWFVWIASSLGFSYALAVAANSSDPQVYFIMTFVIFLLYIIIILLIAFVARRNHRTVANQPWS